MIDKIGLEIKQAAELEMIASLRIVERERVLSLLKKVEPLCDSGGSSEKNAEKCKTPADRSR